MNNKLPVDIENRELPIDRYSVNNNNSYGYVNILYIISMIITIGSVITVIMLGNR